jgi:STAS domain
LKLRLELTGGTALVELRGELDIASVSEVAEVLDGLAPDADGVRHVVLDQRGLTFMDAQGTPRADPPEQTLRTRTGTTSPSYEDARPSNDCWS